MNYPNLTDYRPCMITSHYLSTYMEPISPFHKDQKTTDTTLNLQEAFAIVATGETALYGNIILKKGVIKE